MKPDKYKNNLFVCIKRGIWKILLINIFNSKLFNDIRNNIYKETQINIFAIDSIISDIIDNIQFFSYDQHIM